MNEFHCRYCGHTGPIYGVVVGNDFSRAGCPSCGRSDYLEYIEIPPPPTSTSPDLANCKVCNQLVGRLSLTCPHCGTHLPGLYLTCPHCGSKNITLSQKGFSPGKALVGTIIAGPIGLLSGFIGRKKPEFLCLSCGKKWHPDSELK